HWIVAPWRPGNYRWNNTFFWACTATVSLGAHSGFPLRCSVGATVKLRAGRTRQTGRNNVDADAWRTFAILSRSPSLGTAKPRSSRLYLPGLIAVAVATSN